LKHIKDKYGGIDILVPNAANSTHFGRFIDTKEVDMDKMFDVNFKSVFLLIKEAIPLM
jgi:dehydrogenase/reductase SDR family protein 4